MNPESANRHDRLLDAITLSADIYDQATMDRLVALRETLLRSFSEFEHAFDTVEDTSKKAEMRGACNAIQSILNDIVRGIETVEKRRGT